MVILISIISTIIIFASINLAYGNFQEILQKNETEELKNTQEKDEIKTIDKSIENEMKIYSEMENWQIEIPKIGLIAPIKQGTSRRDNAKLCWTF